MRRAKDKKGRPLPITDRDREELAKFKTYLESIAEKTKRGTPNDEAQAQAIVQVYPEHLPH